MYHGTLKGDVSKLLGNGLQAGNSMVEGKSAVICSRQQDKRDVL